MRISDWSSDVCSSDLSNLFGSDDGALNSAGGSAVGNEAWQVMMGGDANRSQVDPAWLEDIRQKGQEINENAGSRSEEHTSELQSLMRLSNAVFCLKKKSAQ